MVYKAPELGYHTTLLTIPHSYKKKKKKKFQQQQKKQLNQNIYMYNSLYMRKSI